MESESKVERRFNGNDCAFMKILVVCRTHGNHAAAFISEQVDALRSLGHEVQYVIAKKGGIGGYVEFYRNLKKTIQKVHPDIVHAHYGICGLVANLQREVPVVTTYLGSDINDKRIRPISVIAVRLSSYNLFVSRQLMDIVRRYTKPEKTEIMRFGIQSDLFVEQDKAKARDAMGLDADKKYVLFSSRFTRYEKNPELAMDAIARLNELRKAKGKMLKNENDVVLLELTGGYTKEDMVSLMNAVDAALLTSRSEGSPQFTKEVMACGCPIVSVDVGDVAEQVEGLDGCYIVPIGDRKWMVEELANALEKAIAYGRTKGREKLLTDGVDNEQVARKLIKIYESIVVH